MSFDCSRFDFDPWNDYLGVVMQQGRVQLDSDWNEWLSELARRTQAGTLDIIGRAAYPATTPFAFQIAATTSGSGANQITIGPGRMYVDGLLAENHGAAASAQWDPALAEMSGSPQPPGSAPTGTIDYMNQPYFPNVPDIGATGSFLAYLDVWIRPVSYLEAANLVDPAVGVDTTGRLQTVWQVKLSTVPGGTTCGNLGSLSSLTPPWPPLPSAGRLTTGHVPMTASGPCCLSANEGYTGQENQLYRVEIHDPGTPGGASPATFKWSRDNGSVETLVAAIVGATNSLGTLASQLTVQSMGRDQMLGFAPGNWIEITDDYQELNGKPGELHKIVDIDFFGKTLTLDGKVTAASYPVNGTNQTDVSRHTRVTRWDQSGMISSVDSSGNLTDYYSVDATGAGYGNGIPVPPAGTTLMLENGATVAFDLIPSGGSFLSGDYWSFAARTADGSVQPLVQVPPRGIHHHYTPLSVVTFSSSAQPSYPDCRTEWPPSSGDSCGCCTCTVGHGAKFSSIQTAINSLPSKGGEVCILPGRYFENVTISGMQDVVIRGCGWQTRVASKVLGQAGGTAPAANPGPAEDFSAVFTVIASRHIEFRSFAVEAAPGEVGILIDGTAAQILRPIEPPGGPIEVEGREAYDVGDVGLPLRFIGVVDTTIEEMVIAASTLPAILARRAELLRIDRNRIAMKNVLSMWPSVFVSGSEIHIDHNWVGLQAAANLTEWLPASVGRDLGKDAAAHPAGDPNVERGIHHPGGIMIAGPSEDVLVIENDIEGGQRNGVTLGSFDVIDSKGRGTRIIVGVLTIDEDPCDPSGHLQGPWTLPGETGREIVAGGPLKRIQIDRNRISNMGLCGIGPIGFFNLKETLEIITVKDLTISANVILNTLQRELAPSASGDSGIGFGAICLPDVQNAVIRDNQITNFGITPGQNACGVYILHGEMVDISRNQILETRDWAEYRRLERKINTKAVRGGIYVALVTPPTFSTTASDPAWKRKADADEYRADLMKVPVYEPGLPALRVEHNVVRIPLGQALAAEGTGPFTIVNNHFATGGVLDSDEKISIAQTVLILNWGVALEASDLIGRFSSFAKDAGYMFENTGRAFSSNGTVLFTNNVCQLEKRIYMEPTFCSVGILTLDQLCFSNNQCWVDILSEETVTADAFLFAVTIQVTSNRFQEPLGEVALSGCILGALNITSQNISTNCLLAAAFLPGCLVKKENLVLSSKLSKDNDPCSFVERLENSDLLARLLALGT